MQEEMFPMAGGYESFCTTPNNQLLEPMFLGQAVNVARYDQQKYKIFESLIEKQLSFFWRPEEVDISKENVQYHALTEHEKHIFISNLKYQTLMDSIQGRSPNAMLLPIVSIPELETWIETWSFSETIHSRSYTYIVRAIETHPDVVFNDIVANKEIQKRAIDISKYYDALYKYNLLRDAKLKNLADNVHYNEREHMRAIYLALHAVNALEAIRFYVSFACSFAFAERGCMEGNAKIIKFIARDEMLHLVGTQWMIKLLQDGSEGKIWAEVTQECKKEAEKLFLNAAIQEKEWAKYLFQHGAMVGLNEQILSEYVEYLTYIRMSAIGLEPPFEKRENPIPWINTWFYSDMVQVAPQEVEVVSYLTSQVDSSIDLNQLCDIKI